MASSISQFRTHIFTWWKSNKRDLPWRKTHDPYLIMVSEVMLQQTQVQRVIPKYLEFIKRYPTVGDLAKSKPADILKLWRGMGYNRRALYLHRAARSIDADYQGIFPKTEKELVQFPGLGTYTARAILVFAFRQDVAMIDTNIRKIITHFFFDGKPQREKLLQQTANRILPKGKSWEWHQALMDYGALALRVSGDMHQVLKKHVPFKSSNRFYRGRMVDRLRDGAVSQSKLFRSFDKPADFLESILQGLMRDGLVVRTNRGALQLPTSSPA